MGRSPSSRGWRSIGCWRSGDAGVTPARRGPRHLPSRALLLALASLAVLASTGCGHRIPGFGLSRDGVLLVRHTEPVPQEIRVDDVVVGIAQPGGITCFGGVPTGGVRLEARPLTRPSSPVAAVDSLTRATRITLPPEQPLLWDIDHDQVLSGRAHAGLCKDSADGAR